MRYATAFLLSLLLMVSVGHAQDTETLKSRVDSLEQTKKELAERLENIQQRLEDARGELASAVLASPQNPFKLKIRDPWRTLREKPSPLANDLGEVGQGPHEALAFRNNHYKVNTGDKIGWVTEAGVVEDSAALVLRRAAETETRRRWQKKAAERREREQAKERQRLARQRRDREQRRRRWETLRNQGYSIDLKDFGYGTNSADGVTPGISLQNISTERTIKYVSFTLRPFNTVGDPVTGRIQGRSTTTVRGVGPIAPGELAHYAFENTWYNGTVGCVEIRKISVEHSDGSTFTYINDLADISRQATGVNLPGECQ